MPANTPTRIDDELFAAAKAAGALLSRSAAQQVNHWARIGRQLEASGTLSQRDIARVLAGRQSYDSLDAAAQAVVRADWDQRMTERREGLDFTGRLNAAGEPWAEADAAGQTVHRQPSPPPKRAPKKPATVKATGAGKRRTPRPAA